MIVALLLALAPTGLSGWLTTTDAFWGVEWVGDMHETMANGTLILVGLHVTGVILSSVRHGENLVQAMITRKKRAN